MRTIIDRREFMSRTGTAAAGMFVGFGGIPNLMARGGCTVRIGACDWTLGLRANPKSLEMAAKLGLDGIQVDFGDAKAGLPLLKRVLQEAFVEGAKKFRIAIPSLAIGALNDVPYKSDPRAEQWVAESIAVCRTLGARVILLAFFGNGDLRNDPGGIDAVVRRLKEVVPIAEKAGVTLGFESWLSARQHLDILDRVGSAALKVYYDVGNSHKEGYDVYQEIRLLGSRICEFHAKDYDGLYGKGSIDFRRVKQAMDAIGYCGWMHMEGVQMPFGIEESCRQDLAHLREVFSSRV